MRLQEKESNAKFMQYLSGVNLYIFWGTSIVWDLLMNTFTIIIIIVMVAISSLKDINLAILFLILFLYSVAMIPLLCVFSLIFPTPSFGRIFISIFNLIIGAYRMINMQKLNFK